MATITGNQKQEGKIAEMGALAHQMYSEIDLMAFKGIFRFGIQNALTEQGLGDWKQVAEHDLNFRKMFFESVLKGSEKKLEKAGLETNQIEVLFTELRKLNEVIAR